MCWTIRRLVIDATTHVERFVDPSAACFPAAWSPDGTQLAYANNDRISVMDVSSGAIRELAPFPDAVFVMRVVWSPDGTQLASIVTVPCATCFEGGQRGILAVQSAISGDPPRWLADAAAAATLNGNRRGRSLVATVDRWVRYRRLRWAHQ